MASIETFNEESMKIKLFLDILAVRRSIKNVEEAIQDTENEDDLAELAGEHETLTDMVDFLGWQFGLLMGYDFLAQMRKFWGIQISMHNVLQERYYKAQKARYEDCKWVKKNFTDDDKLFIKQNKALNEAHLDAREKASEGREIISEIIEAAFPDAPFDLGWDEHWVEA